jgi:hypothetical protein
MIAEVNLNVRQRLTQVVIFVACVLLSMMIAQVAEASRPKPPRFDKPKYRVVVHTSSQRVVKILYKKRKDGKRDSLFASRKGRKQKQAQAETDI